MSGEVKTTTAEAEVTVTRNSDAEDGMIPIDADDNDTKPTMKNSPVSIAVSSSEAPAFPTAGASDHQSTEISSEPANHPSTTTSDAGLTSMPRSSEDAQEVTEKSDRCSVSCVRDLINSAIEKTLQDTVEQRRSQTPPPSVSGAIFVLIVLLLKPQHKRAERLCDSCKQVSKKFP